MENKNVDELLQMMKEWTYQDQAPAPSKWTEIALYLNLAKEQEYQKLFTTQQQIAKLKTSFLELGNTGIVAKAKVESSDLFREKCIQEAKLDLINDQIALAKAHGKLRSEELRNY